MMLIDTHTHIYMEAFDEDREEVIRNAASNGVEYMVLPNVDTETTARLKSVVNEYPEKLFPAMGLHPTSVKADYKAVLEGIEQEFQERKYYAVGEIGIDLHWDKTFLKQQQEAFARQIEWSLTYDLPIIIHARKSYNEIFQVLNTFKGQNVRGIFHCFSGSYEQAKKIADMGFLMGIGGVLTFKNSKLGETVRHFDLKHFVLETDAPYLAPTPYRGKRNQPAYVRLVARKMADIFNVEIENIAKSTTNNAAKLFRLENI